MLKILTHISRFIIGIVFIYSGFVKLVDPVGTKFKMIEYFEVLNLKFIGLESFDFLNPVALPISILLIFAELILGIMLVVGYKPKFSVWSIFALTIVFLFLTWYSHVYQKVTDCGCFGDAIKLSTGETFYKNVVFMAFIIILIIGMRYIKPLFPNKIGLMVTVLSVSISSLIVFYVLNHLPIIDYRAYAIGNNIKEGMTSKVQGELPPITGFMAETPEGDQLPMLLEKDKVMFVAMYSFDNADQEKGFPAVAKAAKKAEAAGYEVYFLTDIPGEYLPKTPAEYGLPFKFAACDGTALKTAIRANPGIITLEKGTVVGKWSWTDADDVELK